MKTRHVFLGMGLLAALLAFGTACENTSQGGGNGGRELGESDFIDGEDDGYQGVKVNTLRLNKSTLTLSGVGETEQLTYTTDPSDAVVTWMSENGAIASVSQSGLVTAHKGGGVQIIAAAGGKKAICEITVDIAPTAGLYEGEGDAKDLSEYETEGSPLKGRSLLEKCLAWIKDNGHDDGEYTILLDNEESNKTEDGYVIGKFDSSNNSNTGNKANVQITLQSAGDYTVEITKTGTGALFTICGYGGTDVPTLVLGKGITLKGYASNTSALVVVGNTANTKMGKLTMKTGSRITGNTNSTATGGGVNVVAGGVFNMEGGVIDSNKSTDKAGKGGGVLNAGSFSMTGGEINENEAGASGQSGTPMGGGVYDNGIFTMTVGTISSNKSYGRGGGVEAKMFEMKGGIILNNMAANAGGVTITSGATNYFKMSGGVIAGNMLTAGTAGAAVLLYNQGTFEKTGGVIFGTTAANGNANCGMEGITGVHSIHIGYSSSNFKAYYDGDAGENVQLKYTKPSSGDPTKEGSWSTP
jgi:hypothetical protein